LKLEEESSFWRRILHDGENSKGLLSSSPPFGKESLIRIVGLKVSKMVLLSIPKVKL